MSAALCGSWMAKWSIDDAEGWDTGLKEGGRWGVKQVKLCKTDWRMRPLVEGVSQCAWKSPPNMVVACGN